MALPELSVFYSSGTQCHTPVVHSVTVCLCNICVQVFADFAPSALIPNKAVKILQRLGEGGFGTVSLGFLNTGVSETTKHVVLCGMYNVMS